MRRTLSPTCLVLILAVAARAADPPQQPAGFDPARPKRLHFQGQVTAVDARSVTVRALDAGVTDGKPGNKYFRADDRKTWVQDGPHTVVFRDGGTYRPPAGTLKAVRSEWGPDALKVFPAAGGDPVVLKLADQPEWRLVAGSYLADSGHPAERLQSNHYRLSDVRVGDRVSVSGFMRMGVRYAEELSIQRRPGGEVPPSPNNVAKPPFPPRPWYHEMMNAVQEFEEKGSVLPEWYHTGERWILAPMPREAKPKS